MTLSNARMDGLLVQARNGDAGALAELLTGLRPVVYRWALIITGDGDDAEDITQQVCLKLHGKLAGFEQRSSITTWLYAIVRNAAIGAKSQARYRREVRVAPEALPITISDDVEDRIARLDNNRIAQLVRSFFKELPARQRELIELVDTQSCSTAEAAELMGIEPETARVHLLRARRALRARMLELHPELFE